jgi:hypothetical protein
MTKYQTIKHSTKSFLSNSQKYILPTLLLSSCLIIASESFAADAAKAGSADIVGKAADEIKELITGKGRQVIDVGIVVGGAFMSLMKSSWIPIVSSGFGVALFEVLIAVVGK